MSLIAPQLFDSEIQAVAAHFASLPGSPNGEVRSEAPSQVAMGKVFIPMII